MADEDDIMKKGIEKNYQEIETAGKRKIFRKGVKSMQESGKQVPESLTKYDAEWKGHFGSKPLPKRYASKRSK